jgi:hypothetical protein
MRITNPFKDSSMHCRHITAALTVPFAALVLSACTETVPVEEAFATRFGAAERIVAIGDLHGDLEAARLALRLGGAIDTSDQWIGGDLVVVQTGDILDRGDEEDSVIRLFQRLQEEAKHAGGAIHVLNGNHELMNAYHDFRYVTPDGFADFEGVAVVDAADSLLSSLEPDQRARAAAFAPGGPFALVLAQRNTVVIVGSSLFVHGGILPEHVDRGLDSMNDEIRAWLRAEAPQPAWIRGDRSPVWTRLFSREPNVEVCDTLSSVLDRLEVERMVVGHSIQRTGVTSFCGGRIWCIDVGMATHYGGRPEVLEIRGNEVRGLR